MRQRVSKPFSRSLLAGLLLVVTFGVTLLGAGVPAAAQTSREPTPMPLYALPGRNATLRSSGTLALASDNLTVAVANMLSNSITLLVPSQGRMIAEVPVGQDPRSIAFTADGRQVLTANRGDNTLSVVGVAEQTVLATIPLNGAQPYGVVAGANGRAYVSLRGSDEVVVVDLATRLVTQRIPVADAPSGLALWGDFLYVTHYWNGEVSLIYTPLGQVVMRTTTGLDTGAFQSLLVDAENGIAYLPQTRMNTREQYLTYDTTVFPIVNVLDLRNLRIDRSARITLDTADRPVNMPFVAQLDPNQERLYVANAGSDDVSVIDLDTGLAEANIPVGANPRGMLLNRDYTLLFVHNVLDSTITVVDTRTLDVVDVLPVSTPPISSDIFIGAQLFHSADDPRLSQDQWLSCATCHFDGESDGRVWMGFPDGPRNTPVLYDLPETAPYTWTGQWDELADVEHKIRWLQGGTGLLEETLQPPRGEPNSGRSPDLDVLTAYLVAIQPPRRTPSEVTAAVTRGEQVFVAQNCAVCHVGQVGTNLQRFDVGTSRSPLESADVDFDTPSLRWLWQSQPYFHDGAARTLNDVFELRGAHQLIYEVSPEDIDALVAYLLAWPGAVVPE
jgi:YVTN family beta-propeller protein